MGDPIALRKSTGTRDISSISSVTERQASRKVTSWQENDVILRSFGMSAWVSFAR